MGVSMPNEIYLLIGTSAMIGFIHTIFGPDHYLPFIVLSKARKWSRLKTAAITLFCGIGHVLSSIILGFIGIFLGVSLLKLESVEAYRGEFAAWLLIIFGFTYFIWGIHRAMRSKPHTHPHLHNVLEDAQSHEHAHSHMNEHAHVHSEEEKKLTPWILFIIFVFGPCEPLIPLLMYPAAVHNMFGTILVSAVFGFVTISTMLAVVLFSCYGLSKLKIQRFEKYSHAVAGFVIFLSGSAIKFLGL